jgi:hypothetical protein
LGAKEYEHLEDSSVTARTYLSKLAVGKRTGEVVEDEGIEEVGRVDNVDVGRGVGIENTVLLITEV